MWYTILLKCALTHYDTFYYYIMQAFFCQGRFFIFVGMPLKHVLSCFFFVNLHKPDGTAADSKGNTAQSPPDGFARNLCAVLPKIFLADCLYIFCESCYTDRGSTAPVSHAGFARCCWKNCSAAMTGQHLKKRGEPFCLPN